MKRSELEHILRASKGTTDETEFIVIGSQSILGRFPDAPRKLRQSMEADLYPKFRPEPGAQIGFTCALRKPWNHDCVLPEKVICRAAVWLHP